MRAVGIGKHMFWMGQLQTPVACYRKGGCTPEGIPVNPAPEWWGVNPGNSPQVNERIEKNSKIIWETLSKYPYPAPFEPGEAVSFFLGQLKPDLGALAASLDDLDSDSVRLWITLQLLAHYEEWTKMIEAALKRLANRRKKIALEKTIVAAVGSIVMGLAAPAAFAALFSAVNTATQAYIAAKQAREAAEALKNAAQAFSDSDPEFAKEVKRAEEVMDLIAAKGTTPAETPGTPTTPGGVALPAAPKSNTALIVGGGLLAAGAAAFAIFR